MKPGQWLFAAVDSPPAQWWPSMCERCGITEAWFPTQKERNEWEYSHQHGGVD